MANLIHQKLDPLCRRQRRNLMVNRWTLSGGAGAAAAVVAGLLALAVGSFTLKAIGIAALVAGLLGGLAAAVMVKKDWYAAARATDLHFGLADRTLTALTCIKASPQRAVDQLQVRDALQHLERVDARRAVQNVVNWRRLITFLTLTVLAVALLVLPPPAASDPEKNRLDENVFQRQLSTPVDVSSDVAGHSARAVRAVEDKGYAVSDKLGDPARIRNYFQATSDRSEDGKR
jgi:hypothetical protein